MPCGSERGTGPGLKPTAGPDAGGGGVAGGGTCGTDFVDLQEGNTEAAAGAVRKRKWRRFMRGQYARESRACHRSFWEKVEPIVQRRGHSRRHLSAFGFG